MASPLISILTPAYKAQATLGRAVRSVLKQTYSHWEMIIVSDDGVDYEALLKTDGISDARLRFASTGKHRSGPSTGRNIGLDLAKGEFITTLDADDEYHPDYLSVMLDGAKEYGVAMVWLVFKHNADKKKPIHSGLEGFDEEKRLLKIGDYVKLNGRSVTMFHRRLLKHRYAEAIQRGEDFYFDLQLFDNVEQVPIFSERYYIYHDNPASITNAASSDEMFIENYKSIIQDIERATDINPRLRNIMLATYHHRLFQNYMYLEAKERGEVSDFFGFMAKYPQYF